MSRTLILVKPDAFARGLTGEILARFERKGLTIAALKLVQTPRETAETHYAEHAERPFFGELVDFITGGPLVAGVFEGHEAYSSGNQIPISRAADSSESEPWTMLVPTAIAKSPRIEPVLASSGLVAPISWREALTTSSPSSTTATSGAEVMKSTSSPKNGRSACSA